MNAVIVLDLDGVITSEGAYWDTAGLVIHELLYSPRYWNVKRETPPYQPVTGAEESHRLGSEVFPLSAMLDLKARAVNSNWDTCYVGMCLQLIELLAQVPDIAALIPLRPADDDWIAAFRQQLARVPSLHVGGHEMYALLTSPSFEGYIGLALLQHFDAYACERLGHSIEGVFARYSSSWLFCQNLFQEWYLGDKLYEQAYHRPSGQNGKNGCIYFERPLLPVEHLRPTLQALHEQGYILGIGTGRPRQEALVPLENYGLLHYFDERHITTHAEIADAEALLRANGDTTVLVKPHPYQFLLAANPNYKLGDPLPPTDSFLVVGDTTSDMLAGRAANALTIAVLSGARTTSARALLEESGPDFIIEDIRALPELVLSIDSLATIQRLQFTDVTKAQRLLQRWFRHRMHMQLESVTLVPKAVSLNSFNGFYRIDGEEYFFKTHVEEQGVLEEYYHAEMLQKAGYNIVRPLQTLHEQGQQMVIYPVVRWPVMFDLMRALEKGERSTITAEMLVAAEKQECEGLLAMYRDTLAASPPSENAQAPIHQLFWHRLAGERYKLFYEGRSVLVPGRVDEAVPFEKILHYGWEINRAVQRYTLQQLITCAEVVLHPSRSAMTVIGHGDAHFGNVFLEEQQRYLYFDPAFAGRHAVLLDVIKPLFHNVFAMWMYFPNEIVEEFSLSVQVNDDQETISIQHNYRWSALRQAMLQTKMEYLITPLIEELRSTGNLPSDWLEIMQSALLCCPLLTINLLDSTRLPVKISWLGLLFAVLMGNNGIIDWRNGIDEQQ